METARDCVIQLWLCFAGEYFFSSSVFRGRGGESQCTCCDSRNFTASRIHTFELTKLYNVKIMGMFFRANKTFAVRSSVFVFRLSTLRSTGLVLYLVLLFMNTCPRRAATKEISHVHDDATFETRAHIHLRVSVYKIVYVYSALKKTGTCNVTVYRTRKSRVKITDNMATGLLK